MLEDFMQSLKTDRRTQGFAVFLLILSVIGIVLAIIKATKKSEFGAATPKENELVFYYADFCGYCHQFMPIFDETSPELQKMFPGLIITKYQHESDQLIIQQARPSVDGYPTLRLNGAEFQGPRTPEGLVAFVRENYH